MDHSYCIANLTEQEQVILKEMESLFKQKTGKDCVMIAWQHQ